MKYARFGMLAATLFLFTACVTINIYFPAAQAEEAAERIVDDILGNKGVAPADPDKGAALEQSIFRYMASGVLDFLIPAAQAADQPDFNVNTPEIRKLQASMKKRNKSLLPHYESGGIGFTSDALVGTHDSSSIPLRDRNKVKKLLAAENKDRESLYQAIANANGHPEWETDVRNTFAKKWVERASAGWWYQTSKKNWKQK